MACLQLDNMRERATKSHRELGRQVRSARAHADKERGGRPPGRSDYEVLLKHRLADLTFLIIEHLTEHDCQ